MQANEIKDKIKWEKFLEDCRDKTFLQSWHWGEFQKMPGNKIWRLGVYRGEELISIALVIKTVAKRGSFLLIPHGPITRSNEAAIMKYEIVKFLLEKLKEIAKKEKASFIRISPIWQRDTGNNEVFKKLGFREAPIHAHPEASWKLDLTPSEQELLKNMRKTTRYLIRQAQKDKEIEIFQSQKIEDINIFDKLQQAVVKKQKFIPFSSEYLRNELLVFQPDNQISIFFGRYQEKIVAAAFVLFWSNIGFYHHAALSPQYHKIPIAYSLQWEAIKEAKRRKCILYDFWGFINPKEKPQHPWAGPTLFKMGFGGRAYEYVKTQDFPLSKKYWLTVAFEKLRKLKRGL